MMDKTNNCLLKFIFPISLLLASNNSWGYSSFISLGYRDCASCHYNGQGGGALNDYGRAVFASEIASRSFYSKTTTPDELGDRSGFLGKTPLPSWVRPGVKARILELYSDPGSKAAKTRLVPMQFEASSAFIFDQDEKWLAMLSVYYLPTPKSLEGNSSLAKPSTLNSREAYLRWNPNRNWFVYAGLFDKVYGIRTPDHKSFAREKTGNSMFDQAHGFDIQYNWQKWEFSFNPFFGHLGQSEDLRQKGASIMAEKDLNEKHRVGAAVLSSSNQYMKWLRAEMHSKLGYGEGNSFLAEVGTIQDTPKGGSTTGGAYAFLEHLSPLSRGYHLLSQFEFYNQTMSTSSPDQFRWTFGLLAFPAPRYEFRGTVVNTRTQSDSGVGPDQWQIQAQLHLSL